MKKALRWSPVLALLVVAGLACDSANPVAPSGTILTISASSTQIGLNGTTVITVDGRRPNGERLAPGTEIRFTTSLGSLDPVIAAVDQTGLARTTLRAQGQGGTATVQASTVGSAPTGGGSSGDGEEGSSGGTTSGASASIEILVGETEETRPSLLVTVSPNTLFVDEVAEIVVVGRSADGSPVEAGRTVQILTTLGEVTPSNPTTNSEGRASATFVAGTQPGTATITAILGSSEPVETSVEIQDRSTAIFLQVNPSSISTEGQSVTLSVFVPNSQGNGNPNRPVTFDADYGTLDRSGRVLTDSRGVAENSLTVDSSDLTVPEGEPPITGILVTVTTPAGSVQESYVDCKCINIEGRSGGCPEEADCDGRRSEE